MVVEPAREQRAGSTEGEAVKAHRKKRSAGARKLGVAALVAVLPVALVAGIGFVLKWDDDGGGLQPQSRYWSSGATTQSRYWSGALWMGSASGTTGVTLKDIRTIIDASSGTAASLTGQGVGIAMIDTGVAPVAGLPAAQLVNGPDLSFESQASNLRYLDTYGHGTHMAGIIVGNDAATGTVGLAPKAKLTSLKLGTSNGSVDVTQVIAAIDWVVEHRNDDPNNPIRVLNLSYGSGGNAWYGSDPLQFAVEQAWRKGIVVVVAAGNDGNDTVRLTNPATDPFAIAVGATSTNDTLATDDDALAKFSNQAKKDKSLDVLAPGTSVISLRDPGSNIDESFASARVGDSLFKGSGTSQAAAVTSAATALLLQKRPSLTPDQVKHLLQTTGPLVVKGAGAGRGYRQIDVNAAIAAATPTWVNTSTPSTGDGPVQTSRGKSAVVRDDVALTGEVTPFGPFHSANWAANSAGGTSWQGGVWMGTRMAGDGWNGSSFASKTWGSATWPGVSWSGGAWADPSWSSRFWSSRYWSGGDWTSRYWSSDDWSSAYWG
jgi:serine protease AprX